MFCSTLKKKILRQYSGTNTLGLTKVITALLLLGLGQLGGMAHHGYFL